MQTALSREWLVSYSSTIGKSHIDAHIPNQDALQFVQSSDQQCFALVISDGAGSAKRAEEGSRHFVNAIAPQLLHLVEQVHAKQLAGNSRNQVGDFILQMISAARRGVDPSGLQLRDFACNLMAIALGPKWGVRVHLGDAVLLKSSFMELENDHVDFFVNTQMTAQERSEYANETHFLTEPDWTRHLIWDYLDPNGSDDMFALMTDGAADVALSNVPNSSERKVFRGFFAPLVAQILRAPEVDRNRLIQDALASPQTYRLTGDDKTLALVIRHRCLTLAGKQPLLGDENSASGCLPPPVVASPENKIESLKEKTALDSINVDTEISPSTLSDSSTASTVSTDEKKTDSSIIEKNDNKASTHLVSAQNLSSDNCIITNRAKTTKVTKSIIIGLCGVCLGAAGMVAAQFTFYPKMKGAQKASSNVELPSNIHSRKPKGDETSDSTIASSQQINEAEKNRASQASVSPTSASTATPASTPAPYSNAEKSSPSKDAQSLEPTEKKNRKYALPWNKSYLQE